MTQPVHSERSRLNRAFRRVREAGGFTQTGLCCQSCSWAAVAAKGATEDSTVAIHHSQGTSDAFPRDSRRWMRKPLHIYHGGDSRLICEALKSVGLRVEWSGSPDQAIIVLPDHSVN